MAINIGYRCTGEPCGFTSFGAFCNLMDASCPSRDAFARANGRLVQAKLDGKPESEISTIRRECVRLANLAAEEEAAFVAAHDDGLAPLGEITLRHARSDHANIPHH
jgi:hypothetical protein